MIKVREVMYKQLQLFMSNRQYALLVTLILSLLPYTAWLAIIIIAFITLRKGWKDGVILLLPIFSVYLGLSLKSLPAVSSIINACTLFLPCFIGALVLRYLMSWQAVVGVYFILIALIAILVHTFAPGFIISQYAYMEHLLRETQPESPMMRLVSEFSNVNQMVVASYVFGVQVLSVFTSALLSLIVARALQSRLYNAGGFRQEVLSFRANRLGVLILLILLAASIFGNVLAMILLPALFIYFLLAGLSFCAHALNNKDSRLLILLVIPLILVPIIIVPFYSLLGFFDSLFNLRLYKLRPRKRG